MNGKTIELWKKTEYLHSLEVEKYFYMIQTELRENILNWKSFKIDYFKVMTQLGLPRWDSVKESAIGVIRDEGSIPELGRPPASGRGNGNRLQCFYLENPMDRGAWWAAVQGISKELDIATQQQRHH